ncbi:MAG: chromosome segregation protein SMC [Chromatiales bacterium 21-64-14]|nr:MAG: chromosome segregation protein SMC [Chromatiales bacterium 21-64-14]HQU15337.1 chromosome segregation protein SMC [Gammaproteobacteria bacterium]
MRLLKIKLAGFKSFVDPTSIHIPSSLIGIVGPNGCGKSNVIDAVRWVMGESSAKSLRGESMADVIFTGSSARKPVGQATVELVFDNSDGSLGGQYAGYSEISIRRQVARDGQSVYFLNGTRCRRRDITDIFLGTGLGPRSYAIIEQGMISRLIDAKPDELRIFLEEAAGISKYKERRREAETRLRHTKENLSRLNDLRDEIAKQLERLQRQARAAEKYQELKREERQLKAEHLTLRLRSLDREAEAEQRRLQERETALQAATAELRALEADMERQREAQVEANDGFNQVQGRYYGLGADLSRTEQGIQYGREQRQRQEQDLGQAQQAIAAVEAHIGRDREQLDTIRAALAEDEPELERTQTAAETSATRRGAAEQAMQEWQARWEAFNLRAAEPPQAAQVERTRIDHLERQCLQFGERLERIAQEQQSLETGSQEAEVRALVQDGDALAGAVRDCQGHLDGAVGRINGLREQTRQRGADLEETRAALQAQQGRLVSLEALQQAALGQQEGAVRTWLEGQGLQDAPRLAQQLDVESGWERAVETVLGGYLEAVCGPGVDGVLEALDALDGGTLTLLDANAPPGEALPLPRAGWIPLSRKVQSAWPVAGLLAGVYAAADLREALALRREMGATESVVTPDGIWLGSGWLRVVRDANKNLGVLVREREINELKLIINDISTKQQAQQGAVEDGRRALQAAEDERERLQAEVNQLHRRHGELRAELSARQARLEQQRVRADAIVREAAELRAQAAAAETEIRDARGRLETALQAMADLEGERVQLSAERDALRRGLETVREQAQADRDANHRVALRVESQRSARGATEQNLARMQQQQAGLAERRDALMADLAQGVEPLQALEAELAVLLTRRAAVEAELTAARRQVEAIDAALRGQEQARTGIEGHLEALRAALEQERLALREIRVRRQSLAEQLEETGLAFGELNEALAADADPDLWREKLEALEQRIQRLGAINLAAIEEFDQEQERKRYLDAQHADLTEAVTTLENAIRKIDRETRALFKDTFDRVNQVLQQTFPRLFGGGQAYMEMTGDELLDAGVAVLARPPGKRITNIHLLSGGEKALTAVALVFAIFELNPAPFCMLDEVDAPLDDTNVGRFCDLVREMSERVQFVFITHNKVTMEMAHQLTGVTMNEPGVSRLVAVDVDAAVRMAAAG